MATMRESCIMTATPPHQHTNDSSNQYHSSSSLLAAVLVLRLLSSMRCPSIHPSSNNEEVLTGNVSYYHWQPVAAMVIVLPLAAHAVQCIVRKLIQLFARAACALNFKPSRAMTKLHFEVCMTVQSLHSNTCKTCI